MIDVPLPLCKIRTVSTASNSSRRHAVLCLFFASGLSGLVYEVVWIRHLALLFGSTVYATATVLAGFMAGLALGSYFLGRLADRKERLLRFYGYLEIGIAVFAILFPWILQWLTPFHGWYVDVTESSHRHVSFVQALLVMCILIIPTAMMGGTLPILTRYLSRNTGSLGRNLSQLYGLNTLGAVVGCAAAGFILIGTVGVQNTTWCAVAVNIVVAVIAILLDRPTAELDIKEDAVPTAEPLPLESPRWFPRLLLVLLAISGFNALAFEVLWMRVLIFLIGSTSYAFTAVLTTYLCGLALGSIVISRRIDRNRNLLTMFSGCEILISFIILGALVFFPFIMSGMTNLVFVDGTGTHRFSVLASFIILLGGSCLLFILPFTFLLGMIFPLVGKLYALHHGGIGKGVGTVYFADTLGAILGSLAAGFFLVPQFGTLLSLQILAFINFIIGAIALSFVGRQEGRIAFVRKRALLLVLGLLVIIFACRRIITPGTFDQVYDTKYAKVIHVKEDIGGTVTIEQYKDYRTISINGVNVAGTDLRFKTTQKLQAHLALLLHPDPKKVMQIGFGSGGTAWSITRHPVDRINCVEITEAVIKACHHMFEVNHGVLSDKRVNVTIDDARSYMAKCKDDYDVILSDSIHPRRAGNGGLYSVNYFELCKGKLKPDGIFSVWLPIHGLSLEDFQVALRSMKAVWPHVYVWHTPVGRNEWTIVLGMLKPLKVDVKALNAKINAPTVQADLAEIYLERTELLLSSFLMGDENLEEFLGDDDTLNTDDFPYLEYVAPRSGLYETREELLVPVYLELIKHRESVFPYLDNFPFFMRGKVETSCEVSRHLVDGRVLELKEGLQSPAALAKFRKAAKLDPKDKITQDLLIEH